MLVENRDLSARLIDSALQHEGDVFDVAFGETPPSDTRSPPPSLSPAARERQQAEIAAQVISNLLWQATLPSSVLYLKWQQLILCSAF